MRAYYKRLTSQSRKVRLDAARAWSMWEATTSRLIPDEEQIRKAGRARFAEASGIRSALIEETTRMARL